MPDPGAPPAAATAALRRDQRTAPRRRPASGASAGGPPRPAPRATAAAAAGRAGRTLIVSGLRPSTRATRPSVSNLTTWLAAASIVQTLSCGSTRRPIAALKP